MGWSTGVSAARSTAVTGMVAANGLPQRADRAKKPDLRQLGDKTVCKGKRGTAVETASASGSAVGPSGSDSAASRALLVRVRR